MKGENFTLRVPVDLLARIREEARLDGRSVANLMVQLLRRGLESKETLSTGST